MSLYTIRDLGYCQSYTGVKMELNDAAVQASLMHICKKPGGQKSNSKVATCNNCGGVGPSKPKGTVPGASVKVNLAVAEISSRDEYNKYLPETKKQIGKCPVCNQAPYSYFRQFPFGKADWPSNRRETSPLLRTEVSYWKNSRDVINA